MDAVKRELTVKRAIMKRVAKTAICQAIYGGQTTR